MIDPAVAGADQALDTGNVDTLVRTVTSMAEKGLRDRFARAVEARRHASESTEQGRAYVAAYVELAHYAERLRQSSAANAAHNDAPDKESEGGHVH